MLNRKVIFEVMYKGCRICGSPILCLNSESCGCMHAHTGKSKAEKADAYDERRINEQLCCEFEIGRGEYT